MVLSIYRQKREAARLPGVQVAPTGAISLEPIARVVQGAGDAFGQLYEAERRKADRFRAAQADLEAGRILNEASWGEEGFLLAEGENALDPTEKLEGVRQEFGRIAASLPSDAVREEWALRAEARLDDARASFERHSGQQRRKVYEQIADGQVKLALDTVAGSFDDEEAVDRALQRVLVDPDGSPGTLVRYLTEERGLPLEAVSREVTSFLREGHGLAVRKRLEAGDVLGAEAYFEKRRELFGPAGAKLASAISEAKVTGQANGYAVSLIGKARDPETGWVDEERVREGLAKLNEASPAVRAKAHALVREMLGNELAARKAEIQSEARKADGLFNEGGLAAVHGAFTESGENLYAWLNRHDPDTIRAMHELIERRARERRTDAAEARRIQAEIDATLRDEFRGRDDEDRLDEPTLRYYRSRMSERGFASLAPLQRESRDRLAKGQSQDRGEFLRAVRAEVLPAAGKLNSKAQKRLEAEIDATYSDLEAANGGKPPTLEQRRKAAETLKQKVVSERSWLPDLEEPAYQQRQRVRSEGRTPPLPGAEEVPTEAAPAPTGAPESASITPIERSQIIEAWQAKGVPTPTEAQILAVWKRHYGK